MANDSVYAMFLNRISAGKTITIKNSISGELMFSMGRKTYFLGCNQTLNLNAVASLFEIKNATSLHNLVRRGYLQIE